MNVDALADTILQIVASGAELPLEIDLNEDMWMNSPQYLRLGCLLRDSKLNVWTTLDQGWTIKTLKVYATP